MLEPGSEFCSLLWLNNILLCGWTTVCLSIRPWMESWVASSFRLPELMLL